MTRRNLPDTTPASFWRRVVKGPGCWAWLGAQQPRGYGNARIGGVGTTAHRVAYILTVGAIPDGYQVDHLCRNPNCVNPDHLEAVTPRENVLRGTAPTAQNARKTHCVNGHPFGPTRRCVECRRVRQIAARAAARAVTPPLARGSFQRAKKACPQGHAYDQENTYVNKAGSRMCRECMRQRNQARRDTLSAVTAGGPR